MALNMKQGIAYITADILTHAGILHGFFMRHGGCSPAPWKSLNMATSVGDTRENVIENRSRLAKVLGIEKDSFFDVWQVHSNEVISTKKPRPLNEKHFQADAITTNSSGVYLLMLFADCVPILIYDKEHRAVGIAHAGWKGTLNNVAEKLVMRMQSNFGTKSGELSAVIGPCICQDHYEVGKEIEIEFTQRYPNNKVMKIEDGKHYLDLAKSNAINLQHAGVHLIEEVGICTHCQMEDWFSHRGEQGKTGRFAAVIGIQE